tara:strand:+ start:874 stop:2859 length:1986 start_codon:yes stop_codon:yes gene_type:complete
MSQTLYTQSALRDRIRVELLKRKWSDIIESLRPNGTITINVLKEPFLQIYCDHSEKGHFVDNIRVEVLAILKEKYGSKFDAEQVFSRMKINLTSDHHIAMHKLNATDHEGSIVTFDCEVIASETPKSYIKSCTLRCSLCGTEVEITCDIDKKIPVMNCTTASCKKHRLEVDRTTAITENIETVLLGEPMELSKHSSPVVLEGIVCGDLIREVFIGQKKRVTGIYRSIFDLKENINNIVIDVISCENLDESKEVVLTPEQLNKLKEDSKKPDFMSKLVPSFAPHIYGLDIVKKSILLQLAKGGEGLKRGDSHILLVGDPSVAKSEFLKFAEKITPRSMYVSGKGSSTVGLTISIVKEDNGKMYAKAGACPQCNKGFCFIDEAGHMKEQDQSGLNEVLEQQQCSIAKAGFRLTLEAKTTILAAANPKFGKYDPEENLTTNINMPSPLLSRFDLIWLIKDEIVKNEDSKKAEHILTTYINPEKTITSYLNTKELTGYLNHVRKLNPKMTEATKNKILRIYEQMRELSRDSQSIAIGTRQLEAIVRLSTAHAKLFFRDEVLVEDVLAVEDIIKEMYANFGVSLEVAKQFDQSKLTGVGKSESKEQKALRVWSELADEEGLVKDIHFIKLIEKEDGMTEEDGRKIFARWEQNCVIKLVREHFYKKA